jgi:hypothetical protein
MQTPCKTLEPSAQILRNAPCQ